MKAIKKRPAGLCTVRELHGEEWQGVRRPRAYGRWFKASVLNGDLPGVRWAGRKSNKSQLYEVIG